MHPSDDKEELVRAVVDYERDQQGHKLCLPHTPSELKEAAFHNATLVACHVPNPTNGMAVESSFFPETPLLDVIVQ